MNALVSIDVAALTPATVFAPGGVEGIVSKLEAEVRAIDRDISTPEGREAIKSLAYKVARSKTALDDMGKELVADIKAKAGLIDADRRLVRDRLDALKAEVRADVDAWETAEADRVALHESALVFLIESTRFATPPTAATIRERMQSVRAACNRDWQEFSARAEAAAGEAGDTLGAMLAAAEQAERDAAELETLRAEKAARDQADNEARAAAQVEADRKAAEERQKERAAQVEREKAEAVERARQEEQRKAALAIEQARAAERERIEQAARETADAERKRQENKRHRAKTRKEIEAALVTFLMHDAPEEDGDGDGLISAIVDHIEAGRIPHVSITY